jgi:hypothetical protein
LAGQSITGTSLSDINNAVDAINRGFDQCRRVVNCPLTKEGLEITESEAIDQAEFALDVNYPNPFNPSTVIQFDLPKPGIVSLKVYNVSGQEVATLVDNEAYEAGQYAKTFNASGLVSGVYFYRLQAGEFTKTRKMVLMR